MQSALNNKSKKDVLLMMISIRSIASLVTLSLTHSLAHSLTHSLTKEVTLQDVTSSYSK